MQNVQKEREHTIKYTPKKKGETSEKKEEKKNRKANKRMVHMKKRRKRNTFLKDTFPRVCSVSKKSTTRERQKEMTNQDTKGDLQNKKQNRQAK